MPPKTDPYATPRAHFFDALLILFAIMAIAIAIYTAPRRHSGATFPATPAIASAPLALAAEVNLSHSAIKSPNE